MAKTSRASQIEVVTGDVVTVCLDPTLGSEMKKTRPCLVVEAGSSPLDLVIVARERHEIVAALLQQAPLRTDDFILAARLLVRVVDE